MSLKPLLDQLQTSKLLSIAELETLNRSLGKRTSDPARVVEQLVAEQKLTSWQGKQLLRGQCRFDLGKYRLLAPIGAGGMGVVYEAIHTHLNRRVAVKVLRPELLRGERSTRRFQQEMQVMARLDHPQIVKVYDADSIGRFHYFVMELLAGISIEEWLAARGFLPADTACTIAIQTAEALKHAHENGLVHRDIKPANLFLAKPTAGEGYCVKVLDLGLASLRSDSGDSLTQSGDLLGTPDYMAPEQLQDARQADPRSDVFSLGCSLFRLITGEHPFTGNSPMERMVARLVASARPLRSLRPELSPELEGVIAKTLEKDPADRYPTATDMAAALRSFGSTAELQLPTELAESAQRRDVTISDPLAGWLHELDEAATDESDETITIPEVASGKLRTRITLGAGITIGLLLGALVFVVIQYSGTTDLDANYLEQEAWILQASAEVLPKPVVTRLGQPLLQHWNSLTSVAFSPDARLLASADKAGALRVWDIGSQKLLKTVWCDSHTYSVTFHPEEAVLVYSNHDGTVNRLDLRTGARSSLVTERYDDRADPGDHPIALDKAGKLLADARADGSIRVIEFASQREVAHLSGHNGEVLSMAFADSERLVSSGNDGTVLVWDLQSGDLAGTLVPALEGVLVYCLASSPDGNSIITGDSEFQVRSWDLETGRETLGPLRCANDVTAVAYGPDGSFAASDLSGAITVYDHRGKVIHQFSELAGWIADLEFSPDSRLLAVAGAGHSVNLWDLDLGRRVTSRQAHSATVNGVAFHDSGMLVSVGSDHKAIIWTRNGGWRQSNLLQLSGSGEAVLFSHSGHYLATVCQSSQLQLWRGPPTFSEHVRLPGPDSGLLAAVFSPDDQSIIACGRDQNLWTYQIAAGTHDSVSIALPEQKVRTVDLTPDGQWLAVGYSGPRLFLGIGKIAIIDMSDERRTIIPVGEHQDGSVVSIDCHPSRNVLASGSYGGSVTLWDLDARQEIYRLPIDGGNVWSVAFSPNGNQLATATFDGAVRIWDVSAPTAPAAPLLTAQLIQPGGKINCVRFSPNGNLIATANGDGSCYLITASDH